LDEKFLSDPTYDNVDPDPEIPQNIPLPPKSPEYVYRASPMHFAAPEQETQNTIIITELDQHIPLQTTIPPQENLNTDVTPETQTSQPEATQIPPTSELYDATTNVNLEHHLPLSPIAFENLDNDTPLSSYHSSPTSEQLNPIYGPSYNTTRNKAYRGGQTVAVGSEPSSPLCYPAVTVAFLQPPPLCL
jgi:hypothetical protein